MKLTNYTIYQIATNPNQLFDEKTYIPAKANFCIQRNLNKIAEIAKEIEKARMATISHYGILNEETQQYNIPEDKIVEANKELSELFEVEQEIDIKTFSIEALGNVELTTAQMQALMFMITED